MVVTGGTNFTKTLCLSQNDTLIYNYSYSNGTNALCDGEKEEMSRYPTYDIEQRTFLIILLLFILIGNSTVLVAVAVSGRKSRMNFFIKQLAIADLLVGIFSVLPDLIIRFTMKWLAGEFMCKIVKYGMGVVTYGSTFVLVALSIDRLDAIARPLGFSDRRRPRIMITVCWVLAALYSIPFLILFETDECYADLSPEAWQVYLSIVASLVFFIPALIIAICYTAMIGIIWRLNKIPKNCREKKVHETSKPLHAKNGFQAHTRNAYKCSKFIRGRETSMSSRGIIPQAKIRTIKMTFVIIIVFIICWSPYFIFNLMSVYGAIPYNRDTAAIHAFVQSLAPLNSAANPIIYGVFSTRVCRQLRRIRMVRYILDSIGCCIGDGDDKKRKTFTEHPSTTQENTLINCTFTSNVKHKVTFQDSTRSSPITMEDDKEMCQFVSLDEMKT